MKIINLLTRPYTRFPNEVSSQDFLKFIAIITMIIDHVSLFLFPEQLWMRAIGRCSAPIWFFFVGYNYKNSDLFSGNLLYIAIIIALAEAFAVNVEFNNANILFSMLICRWVLRYYANHLVENTFQWFALLFLSLVLFTPSSYFFQYGSLGILLSIWGYNHKHQVYDRKAESLTLFLLYSLIMTIGFRFSFADSLLMVFPLSLVIYALYSYKRIVLNIQGCTKYIINICARYSLYIYCLHVILLIIFISYRKI